LGTNEAALEIAAAVRAGERRAVDVVHEHLARIHDQDPGLGAFVAVHDEDAIADAERVDGHADRASLPLAGVPVAIKDNVEVAGYPTRFGSAATSDTPAQQDDELVRRLRAAGAVVLGKTNLPELAIWPFTEPAAFRPARNPWNRERTSGGSTGGGAVAVAGGLAALALGSDGGGSIRIPAACCGIFGIKPAPGLLPLPRGAASHWLGLSAYGPLARDVAGAAAMLDVLAGQKPAALEAPPSGLRVSASIRHPSPGAPVSAEVGKAVRDTTAILEAEGHRVEWSDPPYPADLAVRVLRRYLPGIAEDAAGLDASRLEARTHKMARAGRLFARRGWAAPAEEDSWRQMVDTWFEGRDLLLMPTLAYPAPPLGRWRNAGWIRTLVSVSRWVLTAQWNLAGVAACSVPAGLSREGLPLAVQLVAPAGRERLLLEVAARIERRRAFPALSLRG
jgi:amidase